MDKQLITTEERVGEFLNEFIYFYHAIGGKKDDSLIIKYYQPIMELPLTLEMRYEIIEGKKNVIHKMNSSDNIERVRDMTLLYDNQRIARVANKKSVLTELYNLELGNKLINKIDKIIENGENPENW